MRDNTLRNELDRLMVAHDQYIDGVWKGTSHHWVRPPQTVDAILSAIKNRLPKEKKLGDDSWNGDIGYNLALHEVIEALDIESES